MIEVNEILLGLLLPALIGALVMLAVSLPRAAATATRQAIGWPLAVGLGFAVGFVTMEPWPKQVTEAQDWIFMLILPTAVVIGLLAAMAPFGTWLALIGALLLAAGMPPLLLQSALHHPFDPWSAGQAARWFGVWGGTALVGYALLRLLERRDVGLALPAALCITTAGVGVVTIMSGSLILGKVGLTLTATLAGATLACIGVSRTILANNAALVAWFALISIAILGRYFAYGTPPTAPYALLALAPLLTCVDQLPPIRRLHAAARFAVAMVAAMIPIAVAVTLAVTAGTQESTGSGGLVMLNTPMATVPFGR